MGTEGPDLVRLGLIRRHRHVLCYIIVIIVVRIESPYMHVLKWATS